MKTSIMSLIAFVAAVILMTGTQGCYTQFSAAREEAAYEDQYSEQAAPADAEEGDAEEGEYVEQEARPEADYGQDWSCQMRFGFDYYYPSTYWPSVGFTVAYNSPYYGWYDPWYSYGYPYYGYGYPYYGYGYPYYPYYDPWYGYPGYWYPTEVVPWQNREFGSTRGTGSTRGGTTRGSQGVNASNGSRQGITDPLEQRQMDLPTASGRTVTGGTAAGTRGTGSGASSATQSSRTNGSSRKDISRKVDKKLTPGQQGTRSARDNKRLYRDRGSVSGSSRSKNSDGTPSVQPQSPSSGGASSRGTSTRPSGTKAPSRSSGSTVRSAPAPAPSVAPAPSGRSGGSAPSGGGSRSGGGGGARSGGGGRR